MVKIAGAFECEQNPGSVGTAKNRALYRICGNKPVPIALISVKTRSEKFSVAAMGQQTGRRDN